MLGIRRIITGFAFAMLNYTFKESGIFYLKNELHVNFIKKGVSS